MMFYKFTKPDGQTKINFFWPLPHGDLPGDWITAPGAATVADGNDCGAGRLHLMKNPFPTYAPWPYIAHEAEPGGLLVGESAEKAGYTQARLLRTLTDIELDAAIESEYERRFGIRGLYSEIAWARVYNPVGHLRLEQTWVEDQLEPLCVLLKRPTRIRLIVVENGDSLRARRRASLGDSLRASLGDSLRASLRASLGDSLRTSLGDSLRASLRASLLFERAFFLSGRPETALQHLLIVWQRGGMVLGYDTTGDLIILQAEAVARQEA